MSVAKPKGPIFDPGLCRCCGTMKRCRVLNIEYENSGQKEVYSDMIMDCYGLLLSHLDGKPSERLVCATCVLRLREAFTFRKQVLRCEEAFLQMRMLDCEAGAQVAQMAEATVEGAPPAVCVKTEPPDDDSIAGDTLADLPDDEPDIKVEANDDSNQGDIPLVQRVRKKPAAPMLEINVAPLTTPARKAKPANLSDKSLASLKKQSAVSTQVKKPVLRATAIRKSVDTKAKNGAATHAMAKRTRPAVEKQAQLPTVPTASQMLQRQKLPMAKVQEMMRERDPTYMIETNALTIIEFSYVCPFKCRHNHLLCHYCGAHFIDPVHLREHTESSHSPKKFKIAEHRNMLKVDLTRIDCRLCPENITNLDDFKKHISSVHNKKYYFDFKDLILPFKLTKNEMKCAVCDVIFPYFHALNKHMNVHFSNYVCETCGLGFVDKGRFVMHQQRHEEGDYPCETCGKVFKAQYNRDLHNDRVHMKRGRVYCPKCDIRLMSYHQKLKHLVEVHGEEPLSFTCNVCDKVFETRRTLTIHRRKDHLKDYRYICQCCGQKFFTRFALNNHMPVHTGARDFKCKVCEKTYPRLKTLKDHIRIHTNDRRYR
ncbi:zinc finger protein 62 homolog isoform X2 [Ostrinia furnacalis]|nr:zinc finger protein 62 homolog isoform X2 [Ostrinia furnacalis]